MGTGFSKRRTHRRSALVGVVVALGLAAAACGPAAPAEAPAPGCPGGPPDAITSTIVNRVNADRGARGLGGLSWNARLGCLANEWSNVMAGNGSLTHRNLSATINSPGFESYAGLGENIFVGSGNLDGNTIHSAWMGSPPHYENIVGNYDSIGVGWARSGDGRLWATENFGRHF